MSNQTKRTIARKLTSRKFIVSLITAIAGIVTMTIGHDEEVATVAGALCTIIPTLTYCIIEGVADIKSIRVMTDAASNAMDDLGLPEVADRVDQFGDVAESFVDDGYGLPETDADKE